MTSMVGGTGVFVGGGWGVLVDCGRGVFVGGGGCVFIGGGGGGLVGCGAGPGVTDGRSVGRKILVSVGVASVLVGVALRVGSNSSSLDASISVEPVGVAPSGKIRAAVAGATTVLAGSVVTAGVLVAGTSEGALLVVSLSCPEVTRKTAPTAITKQTRAKRPPKIAVMGIFRLSALIGAIGAGFATPITASSSTDLARAVAVWYRSFRSLAIAFSMTI